MCLDTWNRSLLYRSLGSKAHVEAFSNQLSSRSLLCSTRRSVARFRLHPFLIFFAHEMFIGDKIVAHFARFYVVQELLREIWQNRMMNIDASKSLIFKIPARAQLDFRQSLATCSDCQKRRLPNRQSESGSTRSCSHRRQQG